MTFIEQLLPKRVGTVGLAAPVPANEAILHAADAEPLPCLASTDSRRESLGKPAAVFAATASVAKAAALKATPAAA